nr:MULTISPECIES: hypothetical protein [Gordonia]
MYHANHRVLGRDAFRDLGRGVGGGVVHNDDLVDVLGLEQEEIECLLKVRRLVVRGNDDGECGQGHMPDFVIAPITAYGQVGLTSSSRRMILRVDPATLPDPEVHCRYTAGATAQRCRASTADCRNRLVRTPCRTLATGVTTNRMLFEAARSH